MSTEKRLAIAAQAAPTGDGAIVLDQVLAAIESIHGGPSTVCFAPGGLQAMHEDLIARAEIGLVKYGTKLRVNNGRRAAVDLYQEILDAVMYAQQARMEDDSAGTLVELLLNIGAGLAAELDRR